jgi:uncharacterized OsmC-like protein
MEAIRSAIEAASRHLAEHPEAGIGPDAPATAVRDEGLRIRVTGPNGQVITDMTATVGGEASAPSPGWMQRAALAACDATLVAMEAAREGIELTDLEVTVESDSDFGAALGVAASADPGPLAVRVCIRLAAENATDEQLRELAERAESRSPVRDGIERAVPVTTEIVTGPTAP